MDEFDIIQHQLWINKFKFSSYPCYDKILDETYYPICDLMDNMLWNINRIIAVKQSLIQYRWN